MIELFRVMSLIRTFEDRVHVLFQDGELPGLLHLCAGQEAGVAGVIAHLTRTDMVTSTHRNHGHGLAKGIDPAAMMTELYGRAGGANDGKGGSMHVADASVGLLAAGGIVGAGAPLALGPALAAKLDGRPDVAVTFFGDGGAQQGTVLESMNLAAVWNLPAIFVCENNVFGQATPVTYASAAQPHARAAGFGIPAEIVDGQDVLAVYEAAGRAIARAREGGGPSFLEIRTYSYHGGWEGESKKSYRLPEIEAEFRERDPLELLDARLEERVDDWAAHREDIEDEVHDLVDAAVEAARQAPRPDPSSLTEGVYADTTVSIDRDGLVAS
jgi:pyruvate dehydrogenase E1 component alpha subunit